MKSTITLSLFLLSLAGLYAQYNNNYEEGIAVYYDDGLHGQATSYGEIYQREGFTAAHQFYPSGTLLRVTRLDNGQSVQVRVNDKMGPDNERKIILSRAAAMQIGLVSAGKLRVRIERADGRSSLPADYSARQSQPARLNAKSPYIEAYNFPDKGSQPAAAYNSPQSYENTPAYRSPAGADVVERSGRALAPGLTGYVIQLASYDNGANAVNSVNQLLQRGIEPAYIWQKDGMNRVVIARFMDKSSAADYLDNLRRQFLLDGIIVQLK